MKKIKGKIILVDEEKYEKELLMLALQKKNWDIKVEYFSTPHAAIKYLKETKDEIFLIISEMNMKEMSGLDFKRKIDQNPFLMKKSIPFIFVSNSASNEQVTEAYDYRVQGYFKKPFTVKEQAEMLDKIIHYWIISRHPAKDLKKQL